MSEAVEDRIHYLERALKDIAVSIAKNDAGKLCAIRAWRAATGATLKDSKNYIESITTPPVQSSISLETMLRWQIDDLSRRITLLERGES
jgi:ribosomal protein L7/L12